MALAEKAAICTVVAVTARKKYESSHLNKMSANEAEPRGEWNCR